MRMLTREQMRRRIIFIILNKISTIFYNCSTVGSVLNRQNWQKTFVLFRKIGKLLCLIGQNENFSKPLKFFSNVFKVVAWPVLFEFGLHF
jgi:hypothetical protein